MRAKTTQLVGMRIPDAQERKAGAEIVFIRREIGKPGQKGRHLEKHIIWAARCNESFDQWGAPYEVLAENLTAAYSWRRHNIFR